MPPNSMVAFFTVFFLTSVLKYTTWQQVLGGPLSTKCDGQLTATHSTLHPVAVQRYLLNWIKQTQVCIISTSQLCIRALEILTLIYYIPCKRPNLCYMCRGLWCREHEESLLMPGMAKRRKIETGFCRTPSEPLDPPTCPERYPNT